MDAQHRPGGSRGRRTAISGVRRLALVALALAGLLPAVLVQAAAQNSPGGNPSIEAATSQVQTIKVGNDLVTVTFQTVSPGVGAAPAVQAGYTEQYAEVLDQCETLIGACDTWYAELYGYWEYNGSTALTVGGPHCKTNNPAPPYTCALYGNGAIMPHNMTWWDYGPCAPAEDTYSIHIYFWGNGSHKVSVSGP